MSNLNEKSSENEQTETVHTQHGKHGVKADHDVSSDPAFDDRVGSDWVGEGGAAPKGPATSTEEQPE